VERRPPTKNFRRVQNACSYTCAAEHIYLRRRLTNLKQVQQDRSAYGSGAHAKRIERTTVTDAYLNIFCEIFGFSRSEPSSRERICFSTTLWHPINAYYFKINGWKNVSRSRWNAFSFLRPSKCVKAVLTNPYKYIINLHSDGYTYAPLALKVIRLPEYKQQHDIVNAVVSMRKHNQLPNAARVYNRDNFLFITSVGYISKNDFRRSFRDFFAVYISS